MGLAGVTVITLIGLGISYNAVESKLTRLYNIRSASIMMSNLLAYLGRFLVFLMITFGLFMAGFRAKFNSLKKAQILLSLLITVAVFDLLFINHKFLKFQKYSDKLPTDQMTSFFLNEQKKHKSRNKKCRLDQCDIAQHLRFPYSNK